MPKVVTTTLELAVSEHKHIVNLISTHICVEHNYYIIETSM